MIDKDKLQKFLPKGSHHTVTDEVITLINNIEEDTGLSQESLEGEILEYLPVLSKVKVSITKYVEALKFISLKNLHRSNSKAWELTFPDRYAKLVREGRWNTSHVTGFNKSPLVVKLQAQMMLDYKGFYVPLFHKAISIQGDLMNGTDVNGQPVSAMVQHLAAKEIATLLKPEESQKIDLVIGQSEEAKSSQEKIYDRLTEIALGQQKALRDGSNIEDIQKLNLTIHTEEVVEAEIL